MSLRKKQSIVLPSDLGNDFTQEDDILTSRPEINWEEPPPEEGDDFAKSKPTEDKRLIQVINGYDRLGKIADKLADDIDKKVGELEFELDPIKDAITISAIKRMFPEKKDPTKLNYQMYKKCLACEQARKAKLPVISPDMVLKANSTNLGGTNSKPGKLRPELTNPLADNVVDLAKFQEQATKDMFKMMEDLVSLNSQAAVKLHESTMKHG